MCSKMPPMVVATTIGFKIQLMVEKHRKEMRINL